ncbi:MAG: hypothetical protein Q9188_002531 [Gyalolechia gomerana]
MNPKIQTRSKRKLDEDLKDWPNEPSSSPTEANKQHHVRNDGVSATPATPTSNTASVTWNPRYRAKRLSKTPRLVRHRKAESHQKGQSAPASFKAVHIPSGSACAPGTMLRLPVSRPSKQKPYRQQPVREAKILQSIEHRVDPHDPTHTPYPWDDPLVFDANRFRDLSMTNAWHVYDTSPPHEPDGAFSPTTSARVSDTEGSPLEKRRTVRKKKQAVRKPARAVAQPSDPVSNEERQHKPSSPVARMKRELTAALDLTSIRLNSPQTPGNSDDILPGNSTEFHGAEVRGLRKEVAHLTRLLNKQIMIAQTKQRDQDLWIQRARDILEKFRPGVSQEEMDMRDRSCSSTLVMKSTVPDTTSVAIHHPQVRSTERSDRNTNTLAQHSQAFQGAAIDTGGASDRLTEPETFADPRTRDGADEDPAKRRQPVPSQTSSKAQMDNLPSAPTERPVDARHQQKDRAIPDVPDSTNRPCATSTFIKPHKTSPSLSTHIRWLRDPDDGHEPNTTTSPAPQSEQDIPQGSGHLLRWSSKASQESQPPQRKRAISHSVVNHYAAGRVYPSTGGNECHNRKAKRKRKWGKKAKKQGKQNRGKSDTECHQVVKETQSPRREATEKARKGVPELASRTGSNIDSEREVSRELSEFPDIETVIQNSLRIRNATQPLLAKKPGASAQRTNVLGATATQAISRDLQSSSKSSGILFASDKRPSSCSNVLNAHQTPNFFQEELPVRDLRGRKDKSSECYPRHGAYHKGLTNLQPRKALHSSNVVTTPPVLSQSLNRKTSPALQVEAAAHKPNLHRTQQLSKGEHRGHETLGTGQSNNRRSSSDVNKSQHKPWERRCRCSELPQYFVEDAHVTPSLATWPAGKEEFLAHCEQIMECPGHLVVTRSACEKIVEAERSRSEVSALLLQVSRTGIDQTQKRTKKAQRGSGNGVNDRTVDDAFAFANAYLAEPTDQQPYLQPTTASLQCEHGTIPSHIFYQKDQPRPHSRPPAMSPPGSEDANQPERLAESERHHSPVSINAKHAAEKVTESPQRLSKKLRATCASNCLPTATHSSPPAQFKTPRVVPADENCHDNSNYHDKSSTASAKLSKKIPRLQTPPPEQLLERSTGKETHPNTMKKRKRQDHGNDDHVSPLVRSRESVKGSVRVSQRGQGSSLSSELSHEPGHQQGPNKRAKMSSSDETHIKSPKCKHNAIHRDGSWSSHLVDVESSQSARPCNPKTSQRIGQGDQSSNLDDCLSKAIAQVPITPTRHEKSIYRRHGTEPVPSPRLSSPAAAVKQATARLSTLPLFLSTGTTLKQPYEFRALADGITVVEDRQVSPTRPPTEECKNKQPCAKERQLLKPKLERNVPHSQRASDEELIRIGRYEKPYIRHDAAPYAFRYDGKLYAEYHYLGNKTDTSGERWSDRLRNTLTKRY